MSSSVISSPRSVPSVFADDSVNNSTELTSPQTKQSTESQVQANDESSNVPKSDEQSQDQEKPQPKSNRPPKADAGPNLIVNPGDKVVLDGVRSTDTENEKLSYSWEQVSTNGLRVILNNDKHQKAFFTAPKDIEKGVVLIFRLTVKDSSGDKDSDTVKITIINDKNKIAIPKNLVTQKSSTNDQEPLQKNSPLKIRNEIRINPLQKNSEVQKSADCTADFCLFPGDTLTFTTTCESNLPNARVQCVAVNIPLGATFTSTIGNPAQGTFTWTPTVPGSFQASFKSAIVFCPPGDPGTIVICLDSDVISVSIEVLNTPPDIQVDVSPSDIVEPGTEVTIDASRSSDPDPGDSIKKFTWSQTAGPNVNPSDLSKPTITFIAPVVTEETIVSFSLTVEDQNGGISILNGGQDIIIQLVNHPPNPVILALPSNTVAPGTFVTLDGKGSTDPDADDSIKSFLWSHPIGDGIVLNHANTATADFVAPKVSKETDIPFTLTVEDTHGAANSAEVLVKIRQLAKVSVSVDKSEINPYPGTGAKPQAQITVGTTLEDGSPAKSIEIELKACTQVGSTATDGHTHDIDTGDPCFHSTRPKAILQGGSQSGNPVVVTTDDTGTAKITYNSPSSLGSDGKSYFISGVDKIIASLKSDPNIKDETKTITTKVPGLLRMLNSNSCPGGTDSYFFESQLRHSCLFFGTANANSELVKIAQTFKQRQIDCAKAKSPRLEPSCNVTPAGSKKLDFVKIIGSPIPVKITAMALPWGGLLDSNGNWKPPYFNHNDGNTADLDFNVNGKIMTIDQKKLLRDVIIDSEHKLPFPGEGKEEDVTKAVSHFTVQFIEKCTDRCPFSKILIKGKISIDTHDRGNLPLSDIRVQLCDSTNNLCKAEKFTDPMGNYELESDGASSSLANVVLKLSFKDKDNRLIVTQYGRTSAGSVAQLELSNIDFVRSPTTGDQKADLSVKFLPDPPYVETDNIGSPAIQFKTNVDETQVSNIAGVYYYSKAALDFSIKNFIIGCCFQTPLTIYVNAPVAASNFIDTQVAINLEVAASKPITALGQDVIERSQDVLFHEFGHFSMFELHRGSFPYNSELNKEYETELKKLHVKQFFCHEGYGQVDSSCALEEAKGSFIAGVLSNEILADPGHAAYRALASNFNYEFNVLPLNLEAGGSIAGDHIYPKAPFFRHDGLAEEFALAQLLWDIYDDTPGEDPIHLDLNSITNSLLLGPTTSVFYKNLDSAKVINKALLDDLFTKFDLCVDTNKDGVCQPGEVKDGTSAWEVRYHGITYGYPGGRQ